MRKLKNRLLLAALSRPVFLFFLLLSQMLHAQVTWDGGASTTNWTDADNWTSNAVPTAMDEVVISGATVHIAAGVSAVALSVSVSGTATLQIAATGSLTINTGSSFALSLSSSNLVNDGSLNITNCTGGISVASASSSLVNNGIISVNNHSHYALLIGGGCTGCSVENNGSMSFDNGTNANAPAIFYQTSGLLFTNNGILDIGQTAHAGVAIGLGAASAGGMTNNGTVNIHNTGTGRAGISTGFLGGAFYNSSTGTVNVGMGIGGTWVGGFNLALTNNGTININKAGSVNASTAGTGTYAGSYPFENTNNFAPGNSGAGCLNFSSGYANIATSPTPQTNIEIGGTTACSQHDRINVTGTANLTGTLNISLINSFVPTAGQSFTLLQATSRVGTYSTVNFPSVPDITWTISYNATGVTINANAVLPVEMVRFTARPHEKKHILLAWETASEVENAGFFIEKSNNGEHWEDIGFVAGNGNSSERRTYFFEDKNPMDGLNYFRLRQTDLDGQEAFSEMKSVDWADSANPVFPNPTHGMFEIRGEFPPDTLLRITDNMGRVIAQQAWSENPVLDFSHAPNGVYFLTISSFNRLIVNRVVKG